MRRSGRPLFSSLASAPPTPMLLFGLFLLAAVPRHAHANDSVVAADDETTYADSVCKPPTAHPSDPLPPCVDIEQVETLCTPNGTAPLYLEAHAQCMCRGSYFPEWDACRQCLFLHGQLSERDLAFYKAIATTASQSLCGFLSTATASPSPTGGSSSGSSGGGPTSPPATPPTAIFKDLFMSIEGQLASPTTGATAGVDVAKGSTDVSLYFTASGPLGPGAITGSAASATAASLVVATGRPAVSSESSATSSLVGLSPSRTIASSAPNAAAPRRGHAPRIGLLAGTLGTVLALSS